MKKKWFRKLFFPFQIISLTLVLLVVGTNSNIVESSVSNTNVNKTIDLSVMALKLEEDIKNDLYSAKDTFVGNLTGYTANCPLCGGTLACKRDYNVKTGVDFYQDAMYGKVKIVASSSNLPCGTIIRFEKDSISNEPVIAIVLDRGVLGNNIDLLTSTEEYANAYVGRSVIRYDVLRNGWGK